MSVRASVSLPARSSRESAVHIGRRRPGFRGNGILSVGQRGGKVAVADRLLARSDLCRRDQPGQLGEPGDQRDQAQRRAGAPAESPNPHSAGRPDRDRGRDQAEHTDCRQLPHPVIARIGEVDDETRPGARRDSRRQSDRDVRELGGEVPTNRRPPRNSRPPRGRTNPPRRGSRGTTNGHRGRMPRSEGSGSIRTRMPPARAPCRGSAAYMSSAAVHTPYLALLSVGEPGPPDRTSGSPEVGLRSSVDRRVDETRPDRDAERSGRPRPCRWRARAPAGSGSRSRRSGARAALVAQHSSGAHHAPRRRTTTEHAALHPRCPSPRAISGLHRG